MQTSIFANENTTNIPVTGESGELEYFSHCNPNVLIKGHWSNEYGMADEVYLGNSEAFAEQLIDKAVDKAVAQKKLEDAEGGVLTVEIAEQALQASHRDLSIYTSIEDSAAEIVSKIDDGSEYIDRFLNLDGLLTL